jgi:hypothetical protein
MDNKWNIFGGILSKRKRTNKYTIFDEKIDKIYKIIL